MNKKILFLFLALLVPGLASAAATINPLGCTDAGLSHCAWDLYVFGNARIINDVLISIKMLMAPDMGQTGFTTVMLVMATLGFLVMAVRAGFNPSQNLVQMFMYILTAWAVSWGTTTLRVNVNIIDQVDSSSPTYTVTGAPAIVALPAVLVSQVGNYFTTTIETYFTTPNELKLSGERVNGFNLFARVMKEANEYTFTDQNLRNSTRAYTADCVIPAIASGRFQATNKNADGTTQTLYGVQALTGAQDFMAALKTAGFNGVYTKYFPITQADGTVNIPASASLDGVSTRQAQSSGAIVSCNEAFAALEEDVKTSANALFQASGEAWSKTGTAVPLESAFNAVLGSVGSVGGATRFAAFGSPQGFISQQAMYGQMSGSFRQAAMQTGNNEMLTAASLAQAEQNQKSAWAAGFTVFNNMMGYVYSVLQAFIFAIMPIVIIALFVPGLGKGIFSNYGQILIWLALWAPMLAIVNYLITLFGTEQIGSIYSLQGGPTLANRGVIAEKTNDLMIAAQFLGISVPMIAWGLVKGAMAFTEFIQHGIGSSFAQQAGASAASGNLSMGNLSMDNTSMNKFSTAMQSTVGFQQTAAFSGAGALLSTASKGGSSMEAHGSAVQSATSLSSEEAKTIQQNQSVSDTFSKAVSMGLSKQETYDFAASTLSREAFGQFVQQSAQRGISYSEERKANQNYSNSQAEDVQRNLQSAVASKTGASLGISLSTGISMSQENSMNNSDAFNKADKIARDYAMSHGGGTSQNEGHNGGQGSDFKKEQSADRSTSVREGGSEQFSEQLSKAASFSKQESLAYSAKVAKSHNISVADGVDERSMANIAAQVLANDPTGASAATGGLEGRLNQGRQALGAAEQLQSGGLGAEVRGKLAQARGAVNQGAATVASREGEVAAAQPSTTARASAEKLQRTTGAQVDSAGENIHRQRENREELPNTPLMTNARAIDGAASVLSGAAGAAPDHWSNKPITDLAADFFSKK